VVSVLTADWFVLFSMEQMVFGLSCIGLGRLDSESAEA